MYVGLNADPETFLAHLELLNRMCYSADVKDWELFATVFTDDVSFEAREMTAPDRPSAELVRLEGRAALLDMLTGREGTTLWLRASHHLMGNHAVEVSSGGTSAKGFCYLRAYFAGGGERVHLFSESLATLEYETVRTDAGWKIGRFVETLSVRLGDSGALFGRDGESAPPLDASTDRNSAGKVRHATSVARPEP